MRTELTAGAPAPTFEAMTDSGDTINLTDYRRAEGRPVLLPQRRHTGVYNSIMRLSGYARGDHREECRGFGRKP